MQTTAAGEEHRSAQALRARRANNMRASPARGVADMIAFRWRISNLVRSVAQLRPIAALKGLRGVLS